jgi:hypothetical protein
MRILLLACCLALLSGCGGDDHRFDELTAAVATAAPAVPEPPTGLAATYGIKQVQLTWDAVAAPAGGGSVTYRLQEDPDGDGPLPAAQVGGPLASASHTQVIDGLLHTRLNARYSVQACNDLGCSTATAPVQADVAQAIGYFKAANAAAGDQFGLAVAISGDGATLAVGAPLQDAGAANSGAVYVFRRGPAGWSQEAYLKASNAGAADSFGASVALSTDGNTLAVGAYLEKGGGAGVGANQLDDSMNFAGAAYVFVRDGASWQQQAYIKASNPEQNDEFGGSVALSGDGNTLAVGAVGEDGGATGIGGSQLNGAELSGAVYLFGRDAAGNWSQLAYVKASNAGPGDRFGHSVALSADGGTLAVGAVHEASGASGVGGSQADNSLVHAGAVYVFARDPLGNWAQQSYLKASQPGAQQVFGTSVALSADGSVLAAGATGEAAAAGAVDVFVRNPVGAWSHQALVKPAGTAPNQWFGRSVALSADGATLAVGSRNESSQATGIDGNAADTSAPEAGAAHVFTRTLGAWTQRAYLKASNTGAGDRFSSVALSADGRTLAVGARNEDSAATGIGGNQADETAANAGAVYLY